MGKLSFNHLIPQEIKRNKFTGTDNNRKQKYNLKKSIK